MLSRQFYYVLVGVFYLQRRWSICFQRYTDWIEKIFYKKIPPKHSTFFSISRFQLSFNSKYTWFTISEMNCKNVCRKSYFQFTYNHLFVHDPAHNLTWFLYVVLQVKLRDVWNLTKMVINAFHSTPKRKLLGKYILIKISTYFFLGSRKHSTCCRCWNRFQRISSCWNSILLWIFSDISDRRIGSLLFG